MRRWRSYYFFIIPVCILVLTFQFPRLSSFARTAFFTVTKPVLILASGVRQGAYDVRYHSGIFLNAVSKQKEYLARIQELESRLLYFQETEKENQRLKKILGFKESLGIKSIGARVIGQDLTPWKKVVVLDKGSRDGIRKDMVIVAPEGLAGRILEVEPFTAQAILLPDPDSRVGALTFSSRAQGVITGIGTDKLQMKYLTLDSNVALEEDVITSGISSIFPKGLQVGKIESIEKDSDGLHLLATVRPSVSFSKIEEVLCFVSPQQK